MKSIWFTSTSLLLLTPVTAYAADPAPAAPPSSAAVASDIIVTGTRQTGMHAADSAAPIQIIGSQAMQNVGQQDLTQVLAASLPSLNFQAFGGDMANMTLSAALRGLNPNDTLVLVNGKRRHGTSNLAVLGSPYQGSAAPDFSFIPVAAISHVEVLQDGAAAQYGSDAIAGVVNIILKDADHGGSYTGDFGQFYQSDGKTTQQSLNAGFKLGQDGFLNLTGEYKYHAHTQRSTCDRRYYNLNCSMRSTNSAVDAAGLEANSDSPDANKINGDAQYAIYNLFFNAGYNLNENTQAYAFGSIGHRSAESYENYRPGSKITGTSSTGETYYPLANGFRVRLGNQG